MPAPTRKLADSYRKRSAKARDTVSSKTPKRTQRERLVGAMIELAAREGYLNVSIAQVSTRAGVSSATFYEQFDGKEDCLLAAYRAARARVYRQVLPIPEEGDWSDAARSMLRGLFSELQREPDVGRMLFVEALAGGPHMRGERERSLGEFEQGVQAFLDSRPGGQITLDIPVAALEGARRNVVSRYLREHSEDRLPLIVEDMVSWMRAYALPVGEPRWSTAAQALLAPPPEPQSGRQNGAVGLKPARLPRGRHGLPAGVVTRSQRTRIMYGTAEVMMAKGYANATVADIVAAAGISREVFYEHFADKQNAFLETQQYGTQYLFQACAAAFFSSAEWPERVWNALEVLIGLIASHPAMSHLRLVECYAAGAAAIRNTEELLGTTAVFLEEGYSYRPEARELPRICSQAIGGAIFEVIYRHLTLGDISELPRQLPQLTYIALAPFMGREEAIAAVEQIRARHEAAGPADGD
jgi:AcrR family transcriptional regulator